MEIKEIIRNQHTKNATVKLDYDELCDIANALYQASKDDKDKRLSFYRTHRDMSFLFDIVKHGCIDKCSVEMLSKNQISIDEARIKRGSEE